MEKEIYLDYQATTPTDPRVLEAMMPLMTREFGNPHSKSHAFGWRAEEYVEHARQQVADLIGADPKDIIFTSGATESNNLALIGTMRFNRGEKNHLITVKTEHKCVIESANYLAREGFEVTFLPVLPNGLIDLSVLESEIRPTTCLVSVMAVNNEIGVIQPLEEIGKICRRHGVYFHSDAAQGYGKIPLDVEKMNLDLMSISGHKIYGPKGIGALYARRKPRVRLEPIIHGGGQERGLRSGTLAAPLIVGLGKAAELCQIEMETEYRHIKRMFDRLLAGLSKIEEAHLNGDKTSRWPGNLNMSFLGIEGESLMMAVKDIAVSSGSACTSSSLEPSYVISALGTREELAHSSLRFGIGRFTTEKEVDYTVKRITEEVARLRDMSPLWEMYKKGVDLSKIKWKE